VFILGRVTLPDVALVAGRQEVGFVDAAAMHVGNAMVDDDTKLVEQRCKVTPPVLVPVGWKLLPGEPCLEPNL